MGVYTVQRQTGTQVYISYTPRGEARVRQAVEFVENAPAFSKRLAEAKRKAAAKLIQRKADIIGGHHKRPQRRRRLVFREYVREIYVPVLRRSAMKERSRENEVHRVAPTGTVGSFFGGYRLDEVTRSVIETFIDKRLSEGTGAAGVNRDLSRLRHLLNDAADRPEDLRLDLPRIPWRRLTMKEEPKSFRPMRDNEEPRLLAGLADPIVRAHVEFLLHTGIRPQAALQLRWEHVDLERMVITVPREINKTAEYRVYLNSRVQELLRALYASRPHTRRQPWVQVFVHRNGKPRRSIRTAWEGACKAAGIEGLHIRGLRATAATRIQERGANEFDVKLHLGHSVRSMGVTGRYIDPHEEHRRRVAELTIRHRPHNVVELYPRPAVDPSGPVGHPVEPRGAPTGEFLSPVLSPGGATHRGQRSKSLIPRRAGVAELVYARDSKSRALRA